MNYTFDPKHSIDLINLAKQGKPVEAYSAECNIPFSILLQWARENPELAEAFELATSYYLDYWLNKLEDALQMPDIAAPITIAKSNIDRFYKQFGDRYKFEFGVFASADDIAEPGSDDEKLSSDAGSSMKW